jgi:hypothetical protein
MLIYSMSKAAVKRLPDLPLKSSPVRKPEEACGAAGHPVEEKTPGPFSAR